MVLVVVTYSSVKTVLILFTKMYVSLPFVHCILWDTIEPVEPLDCNPSFYQPMTETVTNRCHNILKPIWPRTTYARDTLKTIWVCTHGNLLDGKTALKESDQNIRQFKNSQKWLIHVTSPYNIQTLSSKQIMIILKLIRQKLSWFYIKFS